MPAYYQDYLQNHYPGDYRDPLPAFQTVDQTEDFPAMAMLLREVERYRGDGCTITEYTQALRMREAGRLLAETDYSMHRIAGMIGYSTSSRFAELFRRGTGLAPSEYRRMMKESEPRKT